VRGAASFAAALLLLLAPAPGRGEEGFAAATLENGASIAFGLLRTGKAPTANTLGEAALSRSNAVSRVLRDRETGAFFGYRVEVRRERDAFRVTFGPLDEDLVTEALRREGGCPGCPPPAPLGAPAPRFPPPQRLGEGEALTLELLANPTTGERIFDVVKVSARPVPGSSLQAAVERARRAQGILASAAVHVARGRYEAAATAYRQVLELQPRDAVLHNRLGICYQKLGDRVMARRSYDRALELNPDYAEVWNNIGTLEQSAERIEEAVKAYKKAIRIRPDLATPWKNLGNAYLALKKPKEAFEAYQEAFRLDPTVIEAQGAAVPAVGIDAAMQRFYIAKLLAANGHVDAALEFLVRAREAGFDDLDRVRQDPDFQAVVGDARFEVLFGS
jgi:tetratricopeptide (TPR) repeat protein